MDTYTHISPFVVNLGETEDGKQMEVHFAPEVIHLTLICGVTGSGKSHFHESLYKELMSKNSPDKLGFVFLDMTRVDFTNWPEEYMHKPRIVDAKKAIKILEQLANEEIGDKHVFVHIEECDMFAVDRYRVENAILQLKISQPNIHVVYSTSRPSEEVMSHDLICQADLKIIFKVASVETSKRLLMGDSAYHLKLNGEKIIDMKNWKNKIIPLRN